MTFFELISKISFFALFATVVFARRKPMTSPAKSTKSQAKGKTMVMMAKMKSVHAVPTPLPVSKSPSSIPTTSLAPPDVPSGFPASSFPTISNSASLSLPTPLSVSKSPSSIPTASLAPSDVPSDFPSSFPTISRTPSLSDQPSDVPSPVASAMPSCEKGKGKTGNKGPTSMSSHGMVRRGLTGTSGEAKYGCDTDFSDNVDANGVGLKNEGLEKEGSDHTITLTKTVNNEEAYSGGESPGVVSATVSMLVPVFMVLMI